MKQSLDRGILAGIALVVGLIVAAAILNYRNTNQLNIDARSVADSHRVLELTAAVMQDMLDTETGERGYLLTGKDEYLEPYARALPRIGQDMDMLIALTRDNPSQHARVRKLEEMSTVRLALLKQLIDARRLRIRDINPLLMAEKGKDHMDAIRNLVAEIDQAERDVLGERQAASRRAYEIAIITGVVTACLGLLSVLAFILLLNRSLTSRQAAAAAIQAQREWFRTTLASIGDGVIVTDLQRNILFLNTVAAELTGWSDEQARGQRLEQVFRVVGEDGGQPPENPATRALREEKAIARSNQSVLISRNGSETPIDESGAPIRTREGIIAGVVLVFRDVTERRRTEKTLLEADRLKDEYLAMLAHELRNPLAPIRNSLQIMKQAPGKSDLVVPAREMAERQVQHMARLLDDLLDVSRLSRGHIELRCQTIDLVSLAQRTLEIVRPLIEEPRHEIIASYSDKPVLVHGDPTRIEQILTNLLNNAAKYTEPGGQIWLAVDQEGTEAVVRVRDTGNGIAPEMLSRIFDLFVQSRRKEDRSPGGVGIGLTLVRKLVNLHGGSVEAFSQGLEKGSEFVVRLPALKAAMEKQQVQRAAPSSPEHRASGRRILVVDDNVDAAESLALLLRLQGQEVRVAFDGPGALTTARDFSPQAVFLDLGMPGMDGYEVARRMRQELGNPAPVLVALTGWGQDEDRRRSRAAGFDHHVVKPVEPETLSTILER